MLFRRLYMYHRTRYFLNILIGIIVIPIVNGSDYSRLNTPPITITINGELMQLTGGLNRPEPQFIDWDNDGILDCFICLLYTSPSPRDATLSRMPSSA